MGQPSYLTSANPTADQIGRREKFLAASLTVIRTMRTNAREERFGEWDSKREVFCRSFRDLEEVRTSFLSRKGQYDASLKPFFKDYPELCHEAGFLAQENMVRMSHFLERGLPTLKAIFRQKNIDLPPALELLHAEYHKPGDAPAEDRKSIPQQHWFSSLLGNAT